MLLFFGQIHPGANPGRGQNRSRGSPSARNFFFIPEGYSDKPNAYSNDLEACGKKCCYLWFHSEVKILKRFWRLFDFVILAFNAISIDFMWLSFLSALIMCNFHVYKLENAYLKDLNSWKVFLMYFYVFYSGEGKGGCINAYVWKHLVSLYYRTAWWMFTKLDKDEVLMASHMFIGFLAHLNRRLKWAIVIVHGPSSVRRRKLSHFKLLKNRLMDFDENW